MTPTATSTTTHPPPSAEVDIPFHELYSNPKLKIYGVHSTLRYKPHVCICRNMTIVVSDPDGKKEVTLVNSMRLDEMGEEALTKLGTVKRVIRIGCYHGRDDKYYKDLFGAELITVGTSKIYPDETCPPDEVLNVDTDSVPGIPGGRLLVFGGTNRGMSEGVIHVPSEGGILLTCDSIQNEGPPNDNPHSSFSGRHVCSTGEVRECCLGPPWVDEATPRGSKSLEGEFRRIIELKFDKLFSGHGVLLDGGADEKVKAAIEKFYANDNNSS